MLIPIGLDDATVRRQPWVSYGIIALNVLVFLLVTLASGGAERQVRAKGREVFRYLGRHPYLQLPRDLERICPGEFLAQLEAARAQYAEKVGRRDPQLVADEQEHLNTLNNEFFASRRKTPMVRLGFTPAHPGLATLLSSMFVHAGLLHLVGNLLFFFMTGPFLEDLFGRPLFAILYLVSGFAAAGTHALKFPESDIPLVGASGAIAGVMGAFLVRLWARRIRLLFMPILFLVRFTFFLPAFVVLPLWFAEQFWYAQQSGEGSGIAFWAHVGGFGFGVLAAFAIKLSSVEERLIDPAIENEISFVQHPAIAGAAEARSRGDLETARREIRRALTAEVSSVDAWAESYEIALAVADGAEAGRSATRLLDLYVRQGEKDLASGLVRDAFERCGDGLPARFYSGAAGLRERAGDARGALELYEALVQRFPSDPAAFRALFRRGELLRKAGDHRKAREAFAQAQSHPACTDHLRPAVDHALAELSAAK